MTINNSFFTSYQDSSNTITNDYSNDDLSNMTYNFDELSLNDLSSHLFPIDDHTASDVDDDEIKLLLQGHNHDDFRLNVSAALFDDHQSYDASINREDIDRFSCHHSNNDQFDDFILDSIEEIANDTTFMPICFIPENQSRSPMVSITPSAIPAITLPEISVFQSDNDCVTPSFYNNTSMSSPTMTFSSATRDYRSPVSSRVKLISKHYRRTPTSPRSVALMSTPDCTITDSSNSSSCNSLETLTNAIRKPRSKTTSPVWLYSIPGKRSYSDEQLCHYTDSDLQKQGIKRKYVMSLCLVCKEYGESNSSWANFRKHKYEKEIFKKHENSNSHKNALEKSKLN